MSANTEAKTRLDRLEGYLRQDPANLALISDAVGEALRAGVPERGAALVEAALLGMPGRPELLHLLASVRLAQARYDDAIALLRPLLDAGVTAAGVRFNLGYAMFRAGFLTEAEAQLQEVLAQPDAPAATLAYLMRCRHHLGDVAGALKAWESGVEPMRTPEAYGVAGLAAFDAHRLDDARAWADAALGSGAFSPEAAVVRAGIAVAEGQTGEAVQWLERSLDSNPHDGRTWATLGAARLMERDVAGAQEAYECATRYVPRHIGSWHGLAWCHIVSGAFEEARLCFEQALSIDRNFGETHGGLAAVDALQGREADARAAMQRALRLDPQCLSARFAEAVLSGEARNPQAFEQLVARTLGRRAGPLGDRMADYLPLPGRNGKLH